MPQSLACLNVHFIVSTHNRVSFINSELAPRLHSYIGGIVRDAKGVLLSAGGMPDHAHLLISMPRDLSVSDMMRLVKANSSKWMHDEFPELSSFAWQAGYGAFSVSQSALQRVRSYIENQERHHRQLTFQDEYRELLRKHGIAFDERYVWD